jgi:hypothetical protein
MTWLDRLLIAFLEKRGYIVIAKREALPVPFDHSLYKC